MQSITQLHESHTEILSEAELLKSELRFFLKILNQQYAKSISNQKIKLLDNYYVIFEKNIESINQLIDTLRKEENDLGYLIKDGAINIEHTFFNESEYIDKEFRKISNEVKVMKESFYDYMLNNK